MLLSKKCQTNSTKEIATPTMTRLPSGVVEYLQMQRTNNNCKTNTIGLLLKRLVMQTTYKLHTLTIPLCNKFLNTSCLG